MTVDNVIVMAVKEASFHLVSSRNGLHCTARRARGLDPERRL